MNIDLIEFFFWLILSVTLYVYVGYPLILFLKAKIHKYGNPENHRSPLYSFTLFIPAYNEESIIAEKIENALSLNYPAELLEIAVASDGSTDRTNEIIAAYRSNPRVKVFHNEKNEGKNSIINRFVALTAGQIILFTDANSIFSKDAILSIVQHFNDSTVGCVGGKLKYSTGQSSVAKGEGLYFRFENEIRKLEGRKGKMIGANGAIYAIRRDLFEEVPGHVPNDFYHPLVILKKGYRSVFEENAVAYEKATESHTEEFNRRSRIVARSIAALVEVNRRFGIFSGKGWFNILSHKVLRWMTFPMLIGIWVINLLLLENPLYLTLFICQTAFYLLGAMGYFFEKFGMKIRPFYIPYYFLLINIAALAGILHWIRGGRIVSWKTASTTR